ncbi:alpha/beta hydrolase [Erythrobacter sp. SDW2]|uniref:alpha/beta fold hydrolase n=1 Tax=Erythrobacter sp. SDW2 TaxID=2907154 RepID=UPI001F3FE834|nr:alpha/beta hydrolase [Erythrobacter sp. SDW2]UIP06380.1 alpha/beta hydrolase [Erythrobacter sp. SDW2]
MKKLVKILGVIAALLAIAFLFLRVPDTDPAEMRAKYATAPSQFVTLANGQEVHLRDEGPKDAPAIVLLHGSNADLSTWQPWTETLRGDYRVIRFDQIGHGLTGAAKDKDYSPDSFVESVDQVADKLGLEQFVLAGNSMGGAIAMAYAMKHPERLSGLVLVDAGGAPIRREGGGNLAFTLARNPVLGPVLSQMLPRSIIEKSLKQSVSVQSIVTPQMVDRYYDMARYPGNRAATRARFSMPYRTFTAEDVAKVQVPTLVMWGEEDALIPYEAANWYMQYLPQGTLANYRGVGHLPQEEAAERSAADLRKWLAAILAPQPEARAVE